LLLSFFSFSVLFYKKEREREKRKKSLLNNDNHRRGNFGYGSGKDRTNAGKESPHNGRRRTEPY
jgi:hypothetical protein